jgi:hypothetical protein
MGNWIVEFHTDAVFSILWCCEFLQLRRFFFIKWNKMKKKSDFKEFLGSFLKIKIIKLLTSRPRHYLGHPCDHTFVKKLQPT